MDQGEYNIAGHHKVTSAIFSQNQARIFKDIQASKYPKSLEALFFCQKKIDLFLRLIEPLTDEEDYYVAQANVRVIFEHFLVGHYMFTKVRLDDNDTCGVEYYMHYAISEFFKRENYNLRLEGIEKNIPKNNNFENVLKKLPEFAGLEAKDLEGVHKIANQFDIRNILDYLNNKLPVDDYFKESHSMFLQFGKDYNNFSSFVHGGPMAENETWRNSPPINKTVKLAESISWAKTSSRLIKEDIMTILISHDLAFYGGLLAPIIKMMEGHTKSVAAGSGTAEQV